MRFSEWLANQAGRDDPVGDLALDVRSDPPTAPMWGVRELRDHMASRGYDRHTIAALNAAAFEWQERCGFTNAGAKVTS